MSTLYMNIAPGPLLKPNYSKTHLWRMHLNKKQKDQRKVSAKSLRVVSPGHQKKVLLMNLRETRSKDQRKAL